MLINPVLQVHFIHSSHPPVTLMNCTRTENSQHFSKYCIFKYLTDLIGQILSQYLFKNAGHIEFLTFSSPLLVFSKYCVNIYLFSIHCWKYQKVCQIVSPRVMNLGCSFMPKREQKTNSRPPAHCLVCDLLSRQVLRQI